MEQTGSIIFLTAFLILFINFSVPVRAADTAPSTPSDLLRQEVRQLLERTVPDFVKGLSDGRIRELSEYRNNLRNLRSNLRNENDSPEEVFEAFEAVLDSYAPVAEEVMERRVDELDELGELLEEQRERFEESGVVPRSQWLTTYNERLVAETSLDRHHGVLVRVFGLWAAGTLHSDTSYRLETYLESMEGVFPDVTRELLEPPGSSLRNLGYYDSLLTLTEGVLETRSTSSALEDRYLNQLRRQGDLILRISRTRAQRAAVEDLIERIDTILRRRSGREAGLLERNR